MRKIVSYFFVSFVTLSVFSLTGWAETAKGNGQASEAKSFIDIGQQREGPTESRRLSAEETEAVKKYVRQLQGSIQGGQDARSTMQTLKSVKAASSASKSTQALKTVSAYGGLSEVPEQPRVE